MDWQWLALMVGGYLLGAVPFGLVVSRLAGGPDPRTAGSRNIGATNVARLAGKPAGIACLLLDVAKGALPTWLALARLAEPWQAALVGLAAFLGHLYPLYLRFKGGKGVATALGVWLALSPSALGGILLVFGLVAWRTRYVSLASMSACTSAPLWLLLAKAPPAQVALAALMAALVIYRHRENIARLRAGQENRL